MISENPSIGETSNQLRGGKRNMEETLLAFGVSFAKPFLLKSGYSKPSKIVAFWTFHISEFVNTTAMVVNYGTKLGPVDLSSVVPLVEASSGQEWYYVRSACHLVSLWVRLTFSQMYPQVEASSCQEQYYIRSACHLVSFWVRLTFSQMYPPLEASGGQDQY